MPFSSRQLLFNYDTSLLKKLVRRKKENDKNYKEMRREDSFLGMLKDFESFKIVWRLKLLENFEELKLKFELKLKISHKNNFSNLKISKFCQKAFKKF